MMDANELEILIGEVEARRDTVQAELDSVENEIYDFDKADHLTEEQYNDSLDDIYGDVSVAGSTYSTSYLLKEVDPIAYRVGFSDFADSLDYDYFSEYVELTERKTSLEEAIDDLQDEIAELQDELDDLLDQED